MQRGIQYGEAILEKGSNYQDSDDSQIKQIVPQINPKCSNATDLTPNQNSEDASSSSSEEEETDTNKKPRQGVSEYKKQRLSRLRITENRAAVRMGKRTGGQNGLLLQGFLSEPNSRGARAVKLDRRSDLARPGHNVEPGRAGLSQIYSGF